MTKGQTPVAALLAVIAVTLGSNLIVRDSPSARAEPMDCQACPDCQAAPSGSVDVPDLLALLGAWGGPQTPGTTCDLDHTGTVAVPDLLMLLSEWGLACP